MVGGGHTSTEFTGGSREIGVLGADNTGPVLACEVLADAGIVPLVGEGEVGLKAFVPALVGVHPEAVRVSTVEREDLTDRNIGTPPGGRRP